MFYKQLELLCKQNETSVSAVIQHLGMSKGSITSWKNGVVPKGDSIIKLAEYFNVSIDYLLTGKITNDTLQDDELELLSLYRALSQSGKTACKAYMNGYLNAHSEDI